MQHSAFFELSLVIVIAALVSLVLRMLRQPLILSYILSGLLVGPAMFNLVSANETFETFSNVGIALLLFIIGLGLNIGVISKLGKAVFVTAATELLLIGSVGAIVIHFFGYGLVPALIIGMSLFFSSTIIIVKFLSDKREQNRLHGQIAIGVILIEDVIATLALLLVASGGGDESIGLHAIGELLFKGAMLSAGLILASSTIVPWIARRTANSQEMLFLFAIAWGFGVASLFETAGFSIEIGALFAGVSLAGLPYAQEIEARLKPLRDFFVVIFFIVLGQSLDVDHLSQAIWPAIALSAVVLILKPLSIITALGLMGFTKRVSFKAGVNLSQISEFSIVLVLLAVSNNMLPDSAGAVITMVAIVTIAVSSYLIQYDDELFAKFDKIKIKLFDREATTKEHAHSAKYPFIIFGYHRGGHEFVRTFQKMKKRFVVVDYDPGIIENLQHRHIPCQYGDATDLELLEEVGVRNAKMVVSTIADFEINQQLIHHLNLINSEILIVANANNYDEALQLYELGCSYVMIPHYTGSERLGSYLQENGIERHHFDAYREKHLKNLEASHPIDLAEEAI